MRAEKNQLFESRIPYKNGCSLKNKTMFLTRIESQAITTGFCIKELKTEYDVGIRRGCEGPGAS